jgi:hypothetical protein
MATLKGVLQCLWAEVRPAVEARRPDLWRPMARLVNRGKAAEAIAQWTKVLEEPPVLEEEVLRRLARRHAVALPAPGSSTPAAIRRVLWSECLASRVPGLLNCRLLLDDPMPDRVWLHRRGSWVLYRFDGARFPGIPLARAQALVDEGRGGPEELLLVVRADGALLPNPKLPRRA